MILSHPVPPVSEQLSCSCVPELKGPDPDGDAMLTIGAVVSLFVVRVVKPKLPTKFETQIRIILSPSVK